jgi:hypothetical protein
MSRIIRMANTARSALAAITIQRRPPLTRSSVGPISGATTANGAIVRAR